MENDEPLTLAEAATFLKVSARTVSNLIRRGDLNARRTAGSSGKYLVLRSACIDYLSNPTQNRPASMGDGRTGVTSCQSPSGAEYGTVISLPRMEKELGDRLAQRTKSKLRSCTTN
ncbi:helix-turn-helix domain-containing protein [Pantoea dispersa]|uniref:helix-turn-helix domain-containing protein n=1 Tax=Pantoea dispersa TaxID=59814 RepID=UPI0021ADCACB|nr:helix-turn-helix domain-containing protein [Pantoea dispersa]